MRACVCVQPISTRAGSRRPPCPPGGGVGWGVGGQLRLQGGSSTRGAACARRPALSRLMCHIHVPLAFPQRARHAKPRQRPPASAVAVPLRLIAIDDERRRGAQPTATPRPVRAQLGCGSSVAGLVAVFTPPEVATLPVTAKIDGHSRNRSLSWPVRVAPPRVCGPNGDRAGTGPAPPEVARHRDIVG
jgi:hypothetical protein